MAYEKRICVLKQIKKGFSADGGTLSGVVYAERFGNEITITPRILGIAPVKEGRYALAVWAEGATFVLELKGSEPLKIENAPSVKGGFAALLVFLRGEAEPIAYGSCGVAPAGYEPLLEALLKNAKKKEEAVKKSPVREEEVRPFREQAATEYDDEAIAQSDYYRGAADADDDAHTEGEGEGTARENGEAACEDADAPFLRPCGTLTYYNVIRGQLEAAFRKFEKDERLTAIFPHSEWVRTEKDVMMGIIYENGAPKYLCVAVEAKGDPPKQMEGLASFVPASHFTEEEGYWVVFQSADSGEYVTVSDS